jgi:hypothetical protein
MPISPGLFLSRGVPQNLRLKLQDFLIHADKRNFLFTASLAGSLSLAYNALLRHKAMQERVRQSIVNRKIHPDMADFLLRQSSGRIMNNAVYGAFLGAGIGHLMFNRFHKAEEL